MASNDERGSAALRVPVAVSARHVHLTESTIEKLFGSGYRLHAEAPLSQPGQYAAQETIALVGPRGRLENVRILGPPRNEDQIELSGSDEHVLGLSAPLRLSGDLADTPGIVLEGPAGRVTLTHGAICALRHIHMNPTDALHFGVHDRDVVDVAIDSAGRDVVFGDVVVRVSPHYRLELHLDTDEGNAAGISLDPVHVTARVLRADSVAP
ncbi:MAG: phosphate propanoyltransferase [Gammaproteobacteria bacterium]